MYRTPQQWARLGVCVALAITVVPACVSCWYGYTRLIDWDDEGRGFTHVLTFPLIPALLIPTVLIWVLPVCALGLDRAWTLVVQAFVLLCPFPIATLASAYFLQKYALSVSTYWGDWDDIPCGFFGPVLFGGCYCATHFVATLVWALHRYEVLQASGPRSPNRREPIADPNSTNPYAPPRSSHSL